MGETEVFETGEENDDFDPYKARVVEAPVSNFGTLLHFLKGSVGTGILAMPKAFVYTGLIFGSVATFVTGILCSYGLNLLMSSEYLLCKKKRVGYLSYSEALQYAVEIGPETLRGWAKTFGLVANIFLVGYQLGTCCVYVIFVSKNVKAVVDDYHCDLISLRIFMCIFLVLFIAINYVPNLRVFAPFSGVANALMMVGLGIILYFVFEGFPSLEKRSLIGEPSKWVMFIGICLFAMESVGVVVSAENSMERPQDFGGVMGMLNVSMMIVTFLYWFLGFFGYARFGEEAMGSLTLNLPEKNIMSEVTQIFFAGALVISFGLQCFPATEIIWANYMLPRYENDSKAKQMFAQYVLRTALVLLTFALGLAFAEYLATVISFIGVVCISMLGFTFPALMHICALWPDKFGTCQWILVKDIIMVILGTLLMISGVYVSVVDILEAGPGKASCSDMAYNYNSTASVILDSL